MVIQNIFFLMGLGFVSSFIGTLPLSTLNLNILKLALDNRHQSALSFTYSASIVEFIQVYTTLLLMDSLTSVTHLKTHLSLVSIPILLYLGYQSYNTAIHDIAKKEKQMFEKDSFRQGLLLSCSNVMVYPFWLLWGQLFVNNGWLKTDFTSLSIFCMGAGIGTFLAFLIFVFIGRVLKEHLYHLQFLINRLIALTFFGFAVVQAYNILKN